ncbi:hypothetical protein ACP4OV_002262 [Aristida adscensionis]
MAMLDLNEAPPPMLGDDDDDYQQWVLDTEASAHHTSNLSILRDLQKLLEGQGAEAVALDLDQHCCGTVQTERLNVPDVSYVQGDTRGNAISVFQLARLHGLVTVFESTCAYVRDRATRKVIGRAHVSDGRYVLDYLRIDQAKRRRQYQVEGDRDLQEEEQEDEEEEKKKTPLFGLAPSTMMKKDVRPPAPSKKPKMALCRGSRVRINRPFETSLNAQGRPTAFYVDSGACFHSTWNGTVLFRYPDSLNIRQPIDTLNGVAAGSPPIPVSGIGYIDGAGGAMDYVLYVPSSSAYLVSVSQLSGQYSVRVLFDQDRVWIEKLEG